MSFATADILYGSVASGLSTASQKAKEALQHFCDTDFDHVKLT